MIGISRARWPWLVLAALLAGGLAVATVGGSDVPTTEDRVREIGESIMCPTCQGQSVADSNSAAARNIRTEIVRRVQNGQTDEQIREGITAAYGEDLRLTPPRSGVGSLVWFLPVALLVGAIGGLAAAFRYWRPPPETAVSDADRILVEQARRR